MNFAHLTIAAAVLMLSACGEFKAAEQPGGTPQLKPESLGRVIERELQPTLTSELVDSNKNVETFDQSDRDKRITVRYKFNSGTSTALVVDETTVQCGDLKATRLVGPGHQPNESISFKQSLESNSDYALEFDVNPNCSGASFSSVVWIGDAAVEPTRYYRCDGDVLLPLHHMDLSVSVGSRLMISENKKLMCGRDISKATSWSGSVQSGLNLFIGTTRTLATNVDGKDLLATAKIDPKAATLNVTCAEEQKVFSQATFHNCVQVIDDESILPIN